MELVEHGKTRIVAALESERSRGMGAGNYPDGNYSGWKPDGVYPEKTVVDFVQQRDVAVTGQGNPGNPGGISVKRSE